MSRPTFEVADLIHAQGARFVDQHRQHLSYQQLKVLRAIAQCRTAALGGHIDDVRTAAIRPSLITAAATATAPSARRKRANAGSPRENKNCSACLTSMSSSHCRMP